MADNRSLVWDDDHRGKPPQDKKPAAKAPATDGFVRVRRETGGRGGKTVTTVSDLGMAPPQLEELARELKRSLGTGGAVDKFTIVIQGDVRDRLEALLTAKGYKVKRAGG
jgi:translation initiation factor 1